MAEPPPEPARVITAAEPMARGLVAESWYVTAEQWTAIRAILGREPDEERLYSDDEMGQAGALADRTEFPPLVRYRP